MEALFDCCPICGNDLRTQEIPVESLRKGYYGPWEEGDPPRYFSRKILVELREVYDGGLYFQCPDCGGRWHRWPVDHPLREKAERYVNG